jgi:hypothetical protein
MKVFEVIGNPQQQAQPVAVQPTAVKQQARVGRVMQQIAVSDAQPQPPTEMDMVMAMRKMHAKRKQADQAYAKRLRTQSANAERQLR